MPASDGALSIHTGSSAGSADWSGGEGSALERTRRRGSATWKTAPGPSERFVASTVPP